MTWNANPKHGDFPESHAILEEISNETIVFRRLMKWDYKIVFTVDKDILSVLVVQIYHAAQDSENVLEDLS